MYWHCNTAICMRVCWKDCDFRDVYEWSHVCNCALFLSYISCHCMDVCLCLYRTTWTACRYFRIAFIYLLDIYKYIYFTPLPLAGYTAAWYVVWPMGPSNTTLWIKINIYLAKEITLKKMQLWADLTCGHAFWLFSTIFHIDLFIQPFQLVSQGKTHEWTLWKGETWLIDNTEVFLAWS